MSKTDFEKARDGAIEKQGYQGYEYPWAAFRSVADWAYEWFEWKVNSWKVEEKHWREKEQKLAIAVEALEKECWCADNKAEDCAACIALAKIKGE